MDRTGRPCAEPKACGGIAGIGGKIDRNVLSSASPVQEGSRAPQHLRVARFPPRSHLRLGSPLRPAKTSEIRRALVRSPHESGCTASSRICSCNGARKRAKPACRRFSTKTGELSSRCSHSAKTRAASSGPIRGIFCLFRPRFPDLESGILIPLSRRPGWFRVVRPRERPELWTAHYKGQQICGFCGLRSDADNTTVRRGRRTPEAETGQTGRISEPDVANSQTGFCRTFLPAVVPGSPNRGRHLRGRDTKRNEALF